MLELLEPLLGVISLVTLAALMVYGLNAWIMVALHLRHRATISPPRRLAEPLPTVTVQLPLFNERYVVERLLEAVAALDYPRDRLEIQVLDDSTDETSDIVSAVVTRLRARGFEVAHVRRPVRVGFKAGALAEGLAACRGDLVAIFDADFVPPADFLRHIVPHFAPDVAVVQARWGHLNRSFSALTVAQALGMDGHFGVEQSARAWSGLLLNFNGTAGVWRKQAILDAGGWQTDTLTEDLDLSYRAQLRGWRIVYRPDIVCPAELPVVVTGFKSQQRRWAKGSMQTARKLLPAVLRSPLPLWTKYQAFVHLTYYAIHPLMLANVALLLPLRAAGITGSGMTLTTMLVLALTTLGPITMLVYGQWALHPRWWRRAWQLPAILVLGVGVALSTTIAVLGAFLGRRHDFVRTPKFGIEARTGTWRHKAYGEGAGRAGVVEMALGGYCTILAWMFWRDGAYGIAPFLTIYAAGFATVGWLTVTQSIAMQARSSGWSRRRAGAVASRGLGGAASLLAVVAVSAAPAAADPWLRRVAEGERLWTRSPDPTNPVACVTCHHDAEEVSRWAASFPKFKPGPPPDARVMTLWQANVVAVARHYRGVEPDAVATAITAYLTAQGAGRPITPGTVLARPVFEARMQALAASVARGERRYATRCANCHTLGAVVAAADDLRRQIRVRGDVTEVFLARHAAERRGRALAGAAVADLMAYLRSHRAGLALGSSTEAFAEEAHR
jgi:cellulose synthase/poly-beta-1,6-N-acetylglucosamine synthase-like glycosyltransferase/mono/diheme cytochrome c family protein